MATDEKLQEQGVEIIQHVVDLYAWQKEPFQFAVRPQLRRIIFMICIIYQGGGIVKT